MCNIEFPHFGASYPDAHCIYGYLWDMDSYEDGYYTIGGEDPCPFCNTEEWLKTVLDNGEFASREEALEWVEKMREKWGAEHFADEHKMKELGKKEGRTDCSPQGEVPNGNLATQSYENIPNDLEEAAGKCIDDALFKWSYDDEDGIEQYVHDAFVAGAKWQKEQMMKEAVEGEITKDNRGNNVVRAGVFNKDFEYGDKVRVIIVKE